MLAGPTANHADRGAGAAAAVLCLAFCLPGGLAVAAEDDVSELKQAVKELQTQNRALARRLAVLEAEKAGASRRAAPAAAARTAASAGKPPAGTATAPPAPPPPAAPAETAAATRQLEERVSDLELAQTAQEAATRTIIRSSLAKLGPKINETIALGGSLEVLAGRFKDFSGPPTDTLTLNTAELDFDIQANDWTLGSLILQYNNGTNVLFPTTEGFSTGVDRITVDRATITVGDTQRFPLFVRGGRDTLPFGTSTGVHRADVLSIENPLTVEAFEIKSNLLGFGFEFPTPAAAPPGRPVVVPPVQPLVVAPLIGALGRRLGYAPPPARPRPLVPVPPPPQAPPFYGSLFVYEGDPQLGGNRSLAQNVNARLGYRTGGHCGRPYDQLRAADFCPWSLDFSVDYNSSVFDSIFLANGYRNFLDQIGLVPGMAASLKLTLGPLALVGEVNGALRQTTFVDDTGTRIKIMPAAWQLSLAYQFDWNPWVESIGAQGDFIAIGYSGSRDLAGATALIAGQPTRVGFVPQNRLLLTAGEWPLDGLRLAVEYSLNWDYGKKDGGTGKLAQGLFTSMSYNF